MKATSHFVVLATILFIMVELSLASPINLLGSLLDTGNKKDALLQANALNELADTSKIQHHANAAVLEAELLNKIMAQKMAHKMAESSVSTMGEVEEVEILKKEIQILKAENQKLRMAILKVALKQQAMNNS